MSEEGNEVGGSSLLDKDTYECEYYTFFVQSLCGKLR